MKQSAKNSSQGSVDAKEEVEWLQLQVMHTLSSIVVIQENSAAKRTPTLHKQLVGLGNAAIEGMRH